MTYAIYRRHNGSLAKYECRNITVGFFTRTGIFDGDEEIVPEERQESFIKYELERE